MADLMKKNMKYISNSKGLKLYVIEWPPAKNDPQGIVFICYGYGEHIHCGYFETLAMPLNDIDILVSGYDYAGHGRSEGKRGHFDDIDQPIEDAVMLVRILKTNYTMLPIFILGYSFGGIIAILTVIKYPELFKGIILESAALDFNHEIIDSKLICIGTFLSWCCPNLIIKRFSDDLSESDPYRIHNLRARAGHFLLCAIRNIKNELSKIHIPVLAVHGEGDQIIPCRSTVDMINTISSTDKSLRIYSRTKHDIRYDDPTDILSYINDLKQWILERIKT